jgi:hypothetical protein
MLKSDSRAGRPKITTDELLRLHRKEIQRQRRLAKRARVTEIHLVFVSNALKRLLGGTAHVATFDDATPNSGTVVFIDGAGVKRTLDVVSAPFGLGASEVGATALSVEILDDAGAPTGVSFYVMHPVDGRMRLEILTTILKCRRLSPPHEAGRLAKPAADRPTLTGKSVSVALEAFKPF